jgi:hypothetical protein
MLYELKFYYIFYYKLTIFKTDCNIKYYIYSQIYLLMKRNGKKLIVIAIIAILSISLLFPSSVFAEENGVIQIQIHGSEIGDNLKISAYTFQNSWEWNYTLTIDNTFVKKLNGVSIGEIVNVCVINLKEGKEGCSSGTFNSNHIVKIDIDIG